MTQQPTSTPSMHCPLCGAELSRERFLERIGLTENRYAGIEEMVQLCSLLTEHDIKWKDESMRILGHSIIINRWTPPCGTSVVTCFGTLTEGYEKGLLQSRMPGEEELQGDLTAKEIVDAWLAVPVGVSS